MTETKEQLEFKRKRKICKDFKPAWDMQRKIQLEAEKRFNKCVFAIAAGTFGVSFAFINQMIPLDGSSNAIWLIASWLLMGITLILNIADSRVTYLVQDRLLDNIETNIKRGYEGKPYIDTKKHGIMFPTRIIKWVMLAALSAGILSLLYFVWSNVKP